MFGSTLQLLCLFPLVTGYADFQQYIPNGEMVPSPCNPNFVWQGVGHQAKGGGGAINPFGVAFKANGYTWTEELCRADSDSDGMTNGEELGDPDCRWTKGDTPEQRTGLSHPGICEPYNSTQCRQINAFLDCKATEFHCDVVDNDPDIIPVDIRLTETSVPASVTTYMCQALDLPDDADYHLVATKPYIDNINVMHHIVVYGCTDSATIDPSRYQPTECFMNRIAGCEEMIGIWTVGNPGMCYHEDAGYRIGKRGFKRVLIELHWNNPRKVDTYMDSSGLTLYLTPNLRAYDAGMFAIGTAELEIPPGLERYTASSTCSSECTSDFMTGNINIVGTLNHMHYLGSSVESQMVSYNGTVYPLSYEQSYSYDSPKFVIFDEPIVMKPGYDLQLNCHYKSTSRDEVTRYGESTDAEMCYSFIMYYPRANWTAGDCITPWAACGDSYCDFDALGDQTNPDTIARNSLLFDNCEPGYCKEGCMDALKQILDEPCFKGENMNILKQSLVADYPAEMKLGVYNYFYRLDSCNAEFAREECRNSWRPDVDGASSNMASMLLSAVVVVMISIF